MLSPLPDHPEVSSMAEEEERVADAEVGGERKRKKTLGRQKIEIKRIECPVARHVCFSKRRNGLFKKATELCVLTGAHLAIIVSSPAGKPFPFGHPSVDAVIDGYLHPGSSYAVPAGEPTTLPAVAYEYDGERERLEKATAAEGRRRRALDAAVRAAGAWTVDHVRRAGMRDLVAMLAALERVQAEVQERAMMQQFAAAAAAAASDAFQFQYPGAGTFMADGGGGAGSSSSSHQEAMDTMMMLMGDNVSHALPSAPMMLPADLPPQPPVPQAFNYGFADHNHFAAGYAGYGYDLGDGSGHGAGYEMEGYCYETTATTCNFFE